jgi:hypothetical protein
VVQYREGIQKNKKEQKAHKRRLAKAKSVRDELAAAESEEEQQGSHFVGRWVAG